MWAWHSENTTGALNERGDYITAFSVARRKFARNRYASRETAFERSVRFFYSAICDPHGTFFRLCTTPLGQRTSIEAADRSCPRPKCTRRSLEERKPTLVVT